MNEHLVGLYSDIHTLYKRQTLNIMAFLSLLEKKGVLDREEYIHEKERLVGEMDQWWTGLVNEAATEVSEETGLSTAEVIQRYDAFQAMRDV